MTQTDLERQLDEFDPAVRRSALAELIRNGKAGFPSPKPDVNIHLHTFFSFNGAGYSPSRIAWEAGKYGLEVAGIVDFDVLDGLNEFLEAGELLGIKTTTGLETRVYIPEYAGKVITSPNEPGVHYFMIQGCYELPRPGTQVEAILKMMALTARERNVRVMQRVNKYLGDVTLDYDRDVLPLTPSGNATERHLLLAYDRKSRHALGKRAAAFWASVLDTSETETGQLMTNPPAFHEKLRSKLMKFGGAGYVPPDSGSFPTVEQVVQVGQGIGALPTNTWLDGTSEGEEDITALLELLVGKGVVAMNIIPDRNWNINDPDERAVKLAKLGEAVAAAREFDLPLSIGTEMNKAGQPFVDNFQAPEMAPHAGEFLRGAQFFYGHTLLARWADFGYFSAGAKDAFVDDRRARNDFFTRVGAEARPSRRLHETLCERASGLGPDQILQIVRSC
ncbi:MAG: hypothetical protein HYX78_15000 [Armatimonadetes bacterium]|nr:hypothetical protein [Armatimonadota bacterium]